MKRARQDGERGMGERVQQEEKGQAHGMYIVCIKKVFTFLEYCSRIFMKCRAKNG